MGLFKAQSGLGIMKGATVEVAILSGAADPSQAAGVAAPEGSLYLQTGTGISYKKTGAADTEWLKYSEVEGGGLLWSVATAGVTAEAAKGYVLDSTSGSFTVTLPAAPVIGDIVGFAARGTVETNPVTVDPGAGLINAVNETFEIDLDHAYFELIFIGGTDGWVLSNTDESGNLENITDFIGSSDNADQAITEYTSEDVITSGDSLEDALGKVDAQVGDSAAFIGRDTAAADDMPEFSARAGEGSLSASYAPDKVADADDLELAIAKLDSAVQEVEAVATAGVFWDRDMAMVVTGDQVTVAVGDYGAGFHFVDDDAPYYPKEDWLDGMIVLSLNAASLGHLFQWDAGNDQYIDLGVLKNNEAIAVRYDLPDAPGSQEDGAAYKMNSDGTAVIKIADFDIETAASVAMSSAYTPGSGNPVSADTIESAMAKIDGNVDAVETALGVAQGDTSLTTSGLSVVADNSTAKAAIIAMDGELATVSSFIGKTVAVNELPSYSARANTGNVPVGYSPEYIADDDDLELAIAQLDVALKGLSDALTSGALVAGISAATVVDAYTNAGNVAAEWFVAAWDAAGNRYASKVYVMNNASSVDSTEYGILQLGTLDVELTVTTDGTNVSLTVVPTGATVSVKVQRTLITEA